MSEYGELVSFLDSKSVAEVQPDERGSVRPFLDIPNIV